MSEEDKKEVIYRATIKLIQERGFYATPMSLIAKESGVAAGTIYLHFKNKEELLNQLYLKLKKEYNQALLQGLEEGHPVRENLRIAWHNALQYQSDHISEFSYMEQFKNSPFLFRITLEEGIRIFQPIQDLLLRGKKEKILKEISELILFVLFFSPLGELLKQHNRSGTRPTRKEIASTFQGCWDAIQR